MNQDAHGRDIAQGLLKSLRELWSATDYAESQELSFYSEDELKEVLGEWEHVRRAGDRLYGKIRAEHPDMQGWDPISKERPLMGLDDTETG